MHGMVLYALIRYLKIGFMKSENKIKHFNGKYLIPVEFSNLSGKNKTMIDFNLIEKCMYGQLDNEVN